MSEPAPHLAAAERFSVRAAREGLAELAYRVHESPVGELLLVRSGGGLAMLNFLDGELDRSSTRSRERARRGSCVRPRCWTRGRASSRSISPAGARGSRRRSIGVRSGAFNCACCTPPPRSPTASTASYGASRSRRQPARPRAAGNALGANPIAIIVPCHRVLHSGGGFGGYTGGLERKRCLLALELRASGGALTPRRRRAAPQGRAPACRAGSAPRRAPPGSPSPRP